MLPHTMLDLHDRRSFLRAAAASALWATADLLDVEAALAWAGTQKAKPTDAAISALSASQGSALDAMTSRIIPAVDGRPGAHDAGVVYFIDKALATFNAAQKDLYVEGLHDLDDQALRLASNGGRSGQTRGSNFAALAAPQQDDILRAVESTPFFQAVRFDTIVGMFALPAWNGNRHYTGWHMLGLEHQPQFQPPFGYYDAEGSAGPLR
jgi:gluconate 2-dehydrogenase gamma chain